MQEEGSSSSSGLVKGLWRQIVGNSEADEAAALQRDLNPTMSDELEYVPLVLVVGAAGRPRTGVSRRLRGAHEGAQLLKLVALPHEEVADLPREA